MKRQVLCTFSNGGKLIRAHQSQIEFLKTIKRRNVSRAIDLLMLTKTLEDYHDVIKHTISMKRYNTGKQTEMLNELRMCFMQLSKTRKPL